MKALCRCRFLRDAGTAKIITKFRDIDFAISGLSNLTLEDLINVELSVARRECDRS